MHTTGNGADFLAGDKPLTFNDKQSPELLDKMSSNKTVLVFYEDFTHMHVSTNSEELYTIDKSNFSKIATKLLGQNFYSGTTKQECLPFDIPELIDISFDYKDGNYILIGNTSNNQIWTVTFNGVDSRNIYLLDKKITATNR